MQRGEVQGYEDEKHEFDAKGLKSLKTFEEGLHGQSSAKEALWTDCRGLRLVCISVLQDVSSGTVFNLFSSITLSMVKGVCLSTEVACIAIFSYRENLLPCIVRTSSSKEILEAAETDKRSLKGRKCNMRGKANEG
ncbi:unnamed protein product [Caretta caretta]